MSRSRIEENNCLKAISDMILGNGIELRRRWQKITYPPNKTELNNAIQKLIRKNKNESIGLYLSELTNEKSINYSLWKATKN